MDCRYIGNAFSITINDRGINRYCFNSQIFSIAISGNIANYLHEAKPNFHWRYNFHLVSFAATTIIIYISLIPIALWSALKWTARPINPDLVSDEVTYLCLKFF